MESFKDLLQRLQEMHEREVEGWQVKVKELSNKKGCDSKRMEELFTRNQQMKEQHRLLTENIKTLENRLRAGLCDRCTVTQEVAKRKQQEYEASQIQSLQHISLLAGEMTNLKKENLRLKDEIRSLRAALEKDHSDNSSKNNNTVDVKPNVSPDLSPSPGVVAICRMGNQTEDGDVGVKTEANHRSEETQRKHYRATNQGSFEVFKPQPTAAAPLWKTEAGAARARERSAEGFEQYSSIPVQPFQRTSASSPEVKLNRTAIHAPIPCHPQSVKSNTISLPWPLAESSDWVTVASAGTNPAAQNSARLHLPRFPSLVPPVPYTTTRRHSFGPSWQKQSPHQPPTKEPTVVFKLRRVPDYLESENKPPEKKENPPSRSERVSGEGHRETSDRPLDLSDRGKSKSSQTTNDDSPVALHGEGGTHRSPSNNVNPPVSSPSPVVLSSSSSFSTPVKKQEQEPASDHNEVKEQELKEEVVGKTDNGKKVPVLTLSLRPAIVRLESLNAALQKQESMSSNGKSHSSVNELESSLDEQEDESGSGQDNNPSCKRKRASVETETDRDSDTSNVHQERRFKITARTEESSPS